MDLCYSSNNEEFSHTTLADAVDEYYCHNAAPPIGSTATVYEAETKPYKASRFVPDVLDHMKESAYDEAGESAESWDFTKEQATSLQEAVEKAVDDWATANNMQPNFYGVGKSHPIEVRFTNEYGDFELV